MLKKTIVLITLLLSTLGIASITPAVASGDKTPLDIQRQKIEDLDAKIKKLEALSAEAAKKLAKIDKSLKKTQRMEQQVQKLLTELGTSGEEVKKLTDAVSVSEDGNVAIGTPLPNRTQIKDLIPPNEFEINGGITIFGDVENWTNLMNINGYRETGAMKFTSFWDGFHFDTKEAPNAFYIHQNGNVGIGTTDPKAELDVNGNIKAKSFEGQVKKFNGFGTELETNTADKGFLGESNCKIGAITAAIEVDQAAICVCVDGERGKGWYCFN